MLRDRRRREPQMGRPFDRGHPIRRLDATWGGTMDEVKQNGNDSFHFTNCSPQF
jgi:endonuclease G, mitochondrial